MNDALETAFDTFADYRRHLLDAVHAAQRSLILFDRDFAQTGLEGSAGIDAIDGLARSVAGDNLVRILLCKAEHIEQRCPRFLKLVERFGNRVRIRIVGEEVPSPDASFAVADGNVLVTRFHHDRARGKRIDGASAETTRYAAQFETIWMNARSGPSGAPLGI
jgi:hypothetical protein